MDETATTTGPKQATPGDTPSESTTEVLPAADDTPTTQLPAAAETDSPTTELPATSPSDDSPSDDSPTEVIQPATPPSAVESEPMPVDTPAATPTAAPVVPTPGGSTTSDGATPPKPDLLSTKLRRSKDDKMISGVCGGFAKTLNIDPLWLRLGLIVAVLLGFGVGLIVYLACWILMPLED